MGRILYLYININKYIEKIVRHVGYLPRITLAEVLQ